MTTSNIYYYLFLIACLGLSSNIGAQNCMEIQKLSSVSGNQYHNFGESIAQDGTQLLIGAPGKEKCYLYQKVGGVWTESIISRSSGLKFDNYGSSVAIEDDRIVVGASYNNDMGQYAGAVYVYDWNGSDWVETVLYSPNAQDFKLFGYSVGLSGDRIVIGEPWDLGFPGTSYVFDLVGTTWQATELNPSGPAGSFGSAVDIKTDTLLIGASSGNRAYLYNWDGTSWLETEIYASDGVGGDRFGSDVSITNGRFIVGAERNDNSNGSNAGALYVYDWDGTIWNETKLITSDGATNHFLGRSVSVSGDSIVAGVPSINAYKGKTYLFEYSGSSWNESQIEASDGLSGDQFGHKVSILNGTILSSSLYQPDNGINVGAAYLYEQAGGSLSETRFDPSDAFPADQFGYDLRLDSLYMVVGAHDDYDGGVKAGAAHIYEWNGSSWLFKTKLLAGDADPYSEFGYAVDVFENRVLIGAPGDDDSFTNAGSIYIYDWDGSTWQETKLTNSTASAGARFGNSVALYNNRAVVGNIESEVFVFEFDNGTWSETDIIIGSNTISDDRFGYGLDLYEDRILVGARYNDAVAYNAGSAYVFDYDGTNWNETIVNGSDISGSNYYGWQVAINEDILVVGSPGFGGSAYVFEYDGTNWNQTQKVTPSSVSDGDGFGHSVSIHSNRFIVGAPGDDGAAGNSGAAYIYEILNNVWQETEYTASDSGTNLNFGQNVDIYKQTTIVGTSNDNGRAYIFECTCIDDAPPVALCRDITVSLDSNGQAIITADNVDNGSYDDCGIKSIAIDYTNLDCSHVGLLDITLTVTDSLDNTSSCVTNALIEDPSGYCSTPCSNSLLDISTSDIIEDNMVFNDTDTIISNALIQFNNIYFKAKNTIELQAEFEVPFGKTFTLEMGPCP
ncbi:MAG: hypothetical protein HKN09_01405 [Saprospiraceae bacterium]|nr:hypothetical protein [Saprospiraceae bacterium]